MACKKKGPCNSDQLIWCRGYTCINNQITSTETRREIGEPCKSSSDCDSNLCMQPSCNSLKAIGLADKRNTIGVCIFNSHSSLSNVDDFSDLKKNQI